MDQHTICTSEPIMQISNEHVWLLYSFPTQSSPVARHCLRGGACLYYLKLHIVMHWFCWWQAMCREGLSKLACITPGTNLCSVGLKVTVVVLLELVKLVSPLTPCNLATPPCYFANLPCYPSTVSYTTILSHFCTLLP